MTVHGAEERDRREGKWGSLSVLCGTAEWGAQGLGMGTTIVDFGQMHDLG